MAIFDVIADIVIVLILCIFSFAAFIFIYTTAIDFRDWYHEVWRATKFDEKLSRPGRGQISHT